MTGPTVGQVQAIGIDHLQPQARGGTDDLSNLVPCCALCNSVKGAKTLEECRTYLLLQGSSEARALHALQLAVAELSTLADRLADVIIELELKIKPIVFFGERR